MARLEVRVQARASHEQVGAIRQGVLTVRVSAPPLDGRANSAVCRLVAHHLGVAPSRVSLVHGAHARTKLLEIDGLNDGELQARLAKPD